MTRPVWPTGIAPARVELAIGDLELFGFPAAHRHAIAAALERALAELVETRGWPSAVVDSEAEATLHLDPGAPPERIGQAVAEAIFRAAGVGNRKERAP